MECLANGIVSLIVADAMKAYCYRGLAEWGNEKGFLADTCLAVQDELKAMLGSFREDY